MQFHWLKAYFCGILLSFLSLACQPQSKKSAKNENITVNQPNTAPTAEDQTAEDTESESNSNQEPISGKEFFDNEVVSAFNICQRCHAPAEVPVERDRGPMTIYEYEPMFKMLDQNTLIPMIRTTLEGRNHPLRDPCISGLNSSPCKEVVQWWELEFANQPEKAKDRPLLSIGAIVEVTSDGVLKGWAIDPRNLTLQVDVQISIDDPQFSSPLVINANQDLFDNNTEGNHGFSLPLPAQFLDGQSHTLAARVILNDRTEDISERPDSFLALPKAAMGSATRTYFENTVNPMIEANCGCHGNSLTYDYLWDRLINPFPSQGGTATNNRLYRKSAGDLSHPGGNKCTGTNVCTILQEWWEREFTQP